MKVTSGVLALIFFVVFAVTFYRAIMQPSLSRPKKFWLWGIVVCSLVLTDLAAVVGANT